MHKTDTTKIVKLSTRDGGKRDNNKETESVI